MTGRSRFRFRFRGVMSLVKSIASQFFDILQKEEAASNTNVFYDPADLTSLRVGTDGSGGQPVVGDPVGVMLDTSQLGGKTAEDYLAGATNEFADGAASVFGEIVNEGGGRFTLSNGTPATSQTINGQFDGVSGRFYEVTVNIASISGDNITIRPVSGGNVGALGVGIHNFVFQSDGSTAIVRMIEWGGNLTDLDVTFTVKEIPGHHAIAPSDSARPVLFDDPDLTAAALTDNGQRGEELIDGVTAETQSDWIDNGDGSYTSQVSSGGGPRCAFACVLESGAEYEITYTLSNYTAGTYRMQLADNATNDLDAQTVVGTAADGTYSIKIRAIDGNQYFSIRPLSPLGATFSNISVRKVLTAFDERGAELVSDGGWIFDDFGNPSGTPSVSDGVITLYRDNGGNFDRAYHEITTVIGGTYEWIVSNTGAVQVALNVGTSALGTQLYSANLNGATDNVVTFVATSTTTYVTLKPLGSTTTTQAGSVKQVLTPNLVTNGTFDTDSNWTKGTGWSIGSGVASRTGAGNSNLRTANEISIVQNRWYFVQFYVSAYTSGQIRPIVGAGGIGTSVSSTGWHSEYIRCSGSSYLFMQGLSFEGSIDNVIVQELPASIDRKYYLDTDGVDDWMEVKPTLNLGEQWWHVGAWQSDGSGKRAFGTSSDHRGAVRHGGGWAWYNSSSAQVDLTTLNAQDKQVLTIEQAGTNSISGRSNGANSAGVITPYDDSGDTQGLALFTQWNLRFAAGLDGRFYGGSWGQGQVDYDELTVLQDYLGTTTQPPIDPPDVTEYADVYELLAAQTGAVLFDINDKTSLRVGRNGSGGVPVDGDPVGMMLDVSDTGGATVAAATAARPELADTSSVDVNVGSATVVNGQPISLSSGTLYEIVVTISNYVSGNVRLEFKSGQNTNYFSSSTSFVFTPGAGGNVQLRTSGAAQMTVSYSVKEISSHAAIAPSDSARPNLASYNSPISSREVLTTTYGWNITDGGRA